MRFTLAFDMDNDVFAESAGAEVMRILSAIAQRFDPSERHAQSILDANGNRIGQWKVSDDN